MAKKGDTQRIEEMLRRGQLSITDLTTGFRHSIYAHCRKCGLDSPVHRIERSGVAITRAVFRCPACAEDFDTDVSNMFLR